MHIEAFDADKHLLSMQALINRHLEAAMPGWGLPAQIILRSLTRNYHEPLIDPWVVERKTLCAMEGGQFVAAAHLLRYGGDDFIGDWYRNAGAVSWIFTNAGDVEAGAALLAAAREQMLAWGVHAVMVFDNSLPVTLLGGIPDCWPHIAQLLIDAGFGPLHLRKEAIFGGWLHDIPAAGAAPIPNLTVRRIIQDTHTAFAGFIGDEKIGWCEIASDLTEGGDVPQAVEWLRLAGCDRIAFSVDAGDEGRGAGRFYERFGWKAISRMEVGWGYSLPPKE
jgi:hypothetical protein